MTYTELCGGGYVSQLDFYRNLDNKFKTMFGNKKNYHTIEFDGDKREYVSADFTYPHEKVNALGLRGRLPKKNKKLIAALGDSFTESFGAPPDSAYPVLLENLITGINPEWAVLNAGISGSDPFFDFKQLQKIHDTMPVSQALFLINHSDIYDVVSRGGIEWFLENGLVRFNPSPWWEPLYAVSFIFRLYMHSVYKINWSLFTDEENHIQRMKAIEKIGTVFENEIIPWTASKNIESKIVLHPCLIEIRGDTLYYANLRDRLKKIEKIEFYDVLPDITHIENPELYFWQRDGHFNPKGYNLLAEIIFQKLFLNDISINCEIANISE